MTIQVLHGDCLALLPTLDANSLDACVSDPPYGLSFMGKGWDHPDNLAFRPDTWAAVWRVLKPGAHLVAFGGTRTYHRLACAIEDAGFEIRDQLAWVYGSGFPKSHNLGNGWGTALKPSWEPIVLARKPLAEGTVAANVLRHGTGALNIDGCRVPTNGLTARPSLSTNKHEGYQRPWNDDPAVRAACEARREEAHNKRDNFGRWPANLCHDGSAEVLAEFAKYGESKSTAQPRHNNECKSVAKGRDLPHTTFGHSDTGSAARFFYTAKADAADRLSSKHPTVKPVDLMRWLVRLVTPPGGTVLDCFAGSGTTGMACLAESFDAVLIEREAEYVADIRHRLAHVHGHDTPLFAAVAEAQGSLL